MANDVVGGMKVELTRVDRLMLSNQFKILEKLYPEEKDYYEVDRKAIEEGYEIHYEEIFQKFISDDKLPEEASREVLDILSMYRSITFSYENLSSEEKEEFGSKDKIKFKGFDANNSEEIQLLMYTRYFIVDKDRFPELVSNKDYPDFNSHWPMLTKYRDMLELYNSFDDHNLTKHQLLELLEVY